MTYLAQSLAVSGAGGNPDIGAFSGVMTALRKACGLMSEGFQEAYLDVEGGGADDASRGNGSQPGLCR